MSYDDTYFSCIEFASPWSKPEHVVHPGDELSPESMLLVLGSALILFEKEWALVFLMIKFMIVDSFFPDRHGNQ
jgi:hypothetical protein